MRVFIPKKAGKEFRDRLLQAVKEEQARSRPAPMPWWVENRLVPVLEGEGGNFCPAGTSVQTPRLPVQVRLHGGFRMRVLNYLAVRRMCQLGSLSAVNSLESRHYKEAVLTSAHLLRFLNRFYYGPLLIHHMLIIACTSWVITPLEEMAKMKIRTNYAPALHELAVFSRWQEEGFVRALMGERALGVDFFENPDRNMDAWAWREMFDETATKLRPARFIYVLGGRPFLLMDELYFLNFYRRAISSIREGKVKTFHPYDARKFSVTHPASWVLIPNFSKAWEKDREMNARVNKLTAELEALSRP